jgi:hypothetical protein
MRFLPLALCAAALGFAPLQCSKGPDDPELRRYETPPEALYDLAERFEKQGNDPARRATLEYLVERYPNSRFARMAKEELADASATDGDH